MWILASIVDRDTVSIQSQTKEKRNKTLKANGQSYVSEKESPNHGVINNEQFRGQAKFSAFVTS